MAEPLREQEDGLLDVPPDGWTVDDLDAMPESHVRYELTDGALTVTPSPSSRHQVVCAALMMELTRQSPDHLVVTQSVEIRFHRRLTRIPDVLVVRTDVPDRHWFAPAEVLLAVEVESPGSKVADRVTKPAIYAQHGVPSFWRIDAEQPLITSHTLRGDRYVPGPSVDHLVVDEPWALDLTLSGLLPRWAR